MSHLVAVDTLVRPLSGVDAHVFVETGRLGETLSAHRTLWIKRDTPVKIKENHSSFQYNKILYRFQRPKKKRYKSGAFYFVSKYFTTGY